MFLSGAFFVSFIILIFHGVSCEGLVFYDREKQMYVESRNFARIKCVAVNSIKPPQGTFDENKLMKTYRCAHQIKTQFKIGLSTVHVKYLLFLLLIQGIGNAQTTSNTWIANPEISNPNTLSVYATGTNVSYQWYSNSVNSTSNATFINSATSASYAPPLIAGVRYYFAVVNGDCGPDVTSTVVAVEMSANYVWNGSVSTDWYTASNWSPTAVPPTNAHIYIPICTNYPQIVSLTIACGGSVTLGPGTKLTLSEVIHNNGTMNIDDGATLIQTGTGSNTGLGKYHMKQIISGYGGSTPKGRFWYVGSPMSNSVSHDYKAETSAILKYFKEPSGSWVEINDASTPIQVGKGYFVQSGFMDTLEFSGDFLNNGNYTFPCTRSGTTNYYRGFNLVSNPYPSYADFDAVIKTNILPTMWYRTSDLNQNMVFDTYNSKSRIGTSVGSDVVTNFIPPMQSFWVKVPDGYASGELGFSNEMRSHYSIGFEGLKNSATDFPVFIRLNLIDDEKKDQFIVIMDYHLDTLFDSFDSEKMSVPDYPQLYTTVGSKNLVIDALSFSKLRTNIPISVDLPSSKSYQLQIDELNLENTSLILEDKHEHVLQDLSINPCYSFYSINGIISDRFVLRINSIYGTTASTSLIMDESSLFEPQIVQFGLSGDILIRLMDSNLTTECHVGIYDMNAKLVYYNTLHELETMLHLLEGDGIYFVEIDNNHSVYRKRIAIAK